MPMVEKIAKEPVAEILKINSKSMPLIQLILFGK